MTDATHQDLILDQFTRQATVFSTATAITDEDALRMIVEAARPGPDDRLLDLCAARSGGDRDRRDPGNAKAGAQAG